eukprot:257624-Pleurochrysis_carterae.AAC.1
MYTLFLGFNSANLASSYAELQRATGASERIFQLLELPGPKRGNRTLETVKGDIEFRNVCFCYPSRPDVQVANNLSFSIRAGERVAITGVSGSGKLAFAPIACFPPN